MVPGEQSSGSGALIGVGASPAFHTTHWSVVLTAGGQVGPGPTAGEDEQELSAASQRIALERLLNTYWYPVYAFARRRGHETEDACDLVQSFFAGLLESGDLASAKSERGRFRSFLLTCFQNFTSNQWDRENALKRGGGHEGFSLDQALAEERFEHEPSTDQDAEHEFTSVWARALMEEVMQRLRAEYEEKQKGEIFQLLRPMLAGDPGAESYAKISMALGISEGAVKVAAHRLRKRFGEILRREISHTVASPEEIDDEIRGLFAALG